MKKLKIFLCVLLIAGHWFTELGALLWRYYKPEVIYIKPFLSRSYVFPSYGDAPPGHISLFWYCTYLSTDVLWCITFFVMAKIAKQYSFQLFMVASLFFLYHVFDTFMFLYNFKSYTWLYILVHITAALALVAMFIPDKKQAIFKSLN